ncbi:MAG: cupin domain-containing protein [Vicingaceae bacterium]
MSYSILFGKLSKDEFFNKYYEKTFLHLERKNLANYDTLIDQHEIDRIIQIYLAKSPSLKGKIGSIDSIPFDSIFNKFFQFISTSGHSNPFENKGSLVVDRIQNYSPKFSSFLSELKQELGTFLSANLYVTSPLLQTLETHYDLHDVIVMQLCGSKQWTIAPSDQLPTKHENHDLNQLLIEQGQSIELKQGDLLYLPRGFAHKAVAGSKGSCHIAIGVYVIKYFHLLESMLEEAKKKVFFRSSISHQAAHDKHGNDLDLFEAEFKQLLKEMDWEKLMEKQQNNFKAQSQLENSSIYSDFIEQNQVSAQSLLERVGDFKVLDGDSKGFVKLAYLDKEIKFPILLKNILLEILEKSSFKITDINSDLNDSQKLALVKSLIKLGVIEVKE